MFVDYEYYIGLRDVDRNFELKNTSLLAFFEDTACIHSEIAGYGITTMEQTRKTWMVLNWKVKLFKRPKINDKIKIITWSRKVEKIYAFRNFKIVDEDGNVIGIAKSKWLLIDIDLGKFIKIEDSVFAPYKSENLDVDLSEFIRIKDTKESLYTKEIIISKNMIDINDHVHNIYYLDMANNILDEYANVKHQSNEFEICYKKEIKFGEKVYTHYFFNEELGFHEITIRSEDEKTLHSVILLK